MCSKSIQTTNKKLRIRKFTLITKTQFLSYKLPNNVSNVHHKEVSLTHVTTFNSVTRAGT